MKQIVSGLFHGAAMLTFTHLIMMEENINKAADFGGAKHFSVAAAWSTLFRIKTETTATKMTLRVLRNKCRFYPRVSRV